MKYLFLLALFVFVAGCETTEDLSSSANKAEEAPDQISFDATMTTTRNGLLTSKIRYHRMEKFSSRRILKFLDGVEIISYDSGTEKSTTQAQEATLDQVSGDFELRKNVMVRTVDGLQLFAESLTWNEEEKSVHSDDFVTVVTAEMDTLNGTGFESETTFGNWVIKKPSGVSQKKLSLDDN